VNTVAVSTDGRLSPARRYDCAKQDANYKYADMEPTNLASERLASCTTYDERPGSQGIDCAPTMSSTTSITHNKLSRCQDGGGGHVFTGPADEGECRAIYGWKRPNTCLEPCDVKVGAVARHPGQPSRGCTAPHGWGGGLDSRALLICLTGMSVRFWRSEVLGLFNS
jgi:hypothetical protein